MYVSTHAQAHENSLSCTKFGNPRTQARTYKSAAEIERGTRRSTLENLGFPALNCRAVIEWLISVCKGCQRFNALHLC